MATNSCESCGFLEVKTFDMTKIEVDVVPDDQVEEGAREMRRLGRKLAKKKGLTKRDKKLRKIMKELIILLGMDFFIYGRNCCQLSLADLPT